eukprot:TRINITY_DN16871_c0_g1_i1.p1 TRINITY_DN16871_c0_g1~~TRINITY_DN16871_c0_g1_i1.p1  ORF type:complete len:330 (+),score=64.74 TRINITY_DN16871_c0_g1_i1:57-1046(+)
MLLTALLATAVTSQLYDIMYTDTVNNQWVYWGISGLGSNDCCQAQYLYNAGVGMEMQGFLPVNDTYMLAWLGDPVSQAQEKLLAMRRGPGQNQFEDIIRGDTYRYFSIAMENQPCMGPNNYTTLYVRNDDRSKIIFGCVDITTGLTYPVTTHSDPYQVADQGGNGHFTYGGGIYDANRHVLWSSWHQDIPPYSHVQISVNVDGTYFQENASEDANFGQYCMFTPRMGDYPCIINDEGAFGIWNTASSTFVPYPSPAASFISFTPIPNATTALGIDSSFNVYEVNMQDGAAVKQGVLTGTYLPPTASGKLMSFYKTYPGTANTTKARQMF